MCANSRFAVVLVFAAGALAASATQGEAFTYTALHGFASATGAPPSGAVLKSGSRAYGVTSTGGSNGTGVVWRYNLTNGNYTVLYNFCSGGSCATNPVGKLIIDGSENLYGVAQSGGANGSGVVYELVKSGSSYNYQTLYDFCGVASCADGATPAAGLAYTGQSTGSAYNGTDLLYGTTQSGGAGGDGTVFAIEPGVSLPWPQKVLHSFTGATSDGRIPNSQLYMTGGNLFGTTSLGGTTDVGTAFELTPGANVWTNPWTESVIYNFCFAAIAKCLQVPEGVTGDGTNVLVGSTIYGGTGVATAGNGVVFSLDNPGGCSELGVPGFWCLTRLYNFCPSSGCVDGDTPNGDLVVDGSANIYGTTGAGGANNKGTVFEIASGGGESVIYDYCGAGSCSDGAYPLIGLGIDNGGDLFSVTSQGGGSNVGELVEFTNP